MDWHAEGSDGPQVDICDERDGVIATVYGNGAGEARTRAQVMAVAPELLKALITVIRELDDLDYVDGETITHAKAVIAKAETRS